jgi:UDP-GlcNAc3NAcA epimerase
VFFRDLGIPEPRYNLGVHSLGHGAMTGRSLEQIENACLAEDADMVLVYGDTNATLAGALCGAKLNVPVAHVEAGLRSFNRRMPEEINRIVADHVSTLLFCPTETARENLAREGLAERAYLVGDVMYDAALQAKTAGRPRMLGELGLDPKKYAVATVHRAENTDDAGVFATIMEYLSREAETHPIVFPAHPRVRERLSRWRDRRNLRVIAPLGYLDMAELVSQAAAIYTDSGGLQKEAYFHRVPCVTLRDETEWVETVRSGWNRLWGTPEYLPRKEISDYGDGHAGERIAEALVQHLEHA